MSSRVARNVDRARHADEQQRRVGVARSAHNGAYHVVENDYQSPAAANPQINDGLRVRLRWDAQQRRYIPGEKFKRRRHNDAEQGEKNDRRADGVARQIAPPFADVMATQRSTV